ncbi:MAG TPA: hypothetical protein VFG09_14125 [Thermodesulfovibrionales bacterium]|jgi:hypothetical protein|nr:hypothetical protein [Thermodesulfovibrionales bacterium]
MSESINYNNFSEEEDRLYKKNIEMIRSSIRDGVKFDLACEFVPREDKQLRDLIVDDALKIQIAEMHYGTGLSLLDVSKRLGVSMERLLKANTEMMEDVMNSAAEFGRRQSGGSEPLMH